ncbi:MAG: extracellular solute-binding protein [Nitrososphaerota archaeon]
MKRAYIIGAIVAVIAIVAGLSAVLFVAPPSREVVTSIVTVPGGERVVTLVTTVAGREVTQVVTQERVVTQVVTVERPKLIIWWNKGYYAEEDLALMQAAQEFGRLKGADVEVSFFTTEDIPKKLIAALEAGNPPDVAYAHFEDWMLSPRWAWDGLLEDVSDIVNENKDRYIPEALQTAWLYNNKEKKYSYYKVPMQMQTIHIHYWKDFVAEAGFDPAPEKIPRTWDEFWNFWFTVQDRLRAKDPEKYREVYAVGWTLGTGSTDAFYNFETIYLYYAKKPIVTPDGKLNLDDPDVREALINTFKFIVNLHEKGYNPPGSLTWTDPDNNVAFHARKIVMVPNPTISIPAAQYFGAVGSRENYYTKMATVDWPTGPDGREPPRLIAVKSLLVFKASKNKELAKDFIRYFISKDILNAYTKASAGRWAPVFKDILNEDKFYFEGFKAGAATFGAPGDPHVPVAYNQFRTGKLVPFYYVYHPAYSQVYAERTWIVYLNKVIVEKYPLEKAVDEAIARVKQIFAEWK